MKTLFFPLILILSLSCTQQHSEHVVSNDDSSQKDQIISPLKHLVCFSTIDSLSKKDSSFLIEQLKSLRNIEGVGALEVGTRAETGDPRMDKHFNFTLMVSFENRKAMDSYRVDSLHLAVRNRVKHLFNAPPMVVDYWLAQ